jgi:hypothetical protein
MWSIYDTATDQVLNGVREKTLLRSDVKISRRKCATYSKEIELGDHFSFALADELPRDNHERATTRGADGRERDDEGYVITGAAHRIQDDGQYGFGLFGKRDDVPTFSGDLFVVDRPGHANKLQESGELSFDNRKTPGSIEIDHLRFLTDITIRVDRSGTVAAEEPTWRIKTFKGSAISWPSVDIEGESPKKD